jgi:hypothetical protein
MVQNIGSGETKRTYLMNYRDYMRWAWERGVAVAVFIGGLLTIYEIWERVSANEHLLGVVSVLYLFTVITIIAIWAISKMLSTMKKERYADVSSQIHEILHGIRNLTTYMDQQHDIVAKTGEFGPYQDVVRDMFVGILTNIALLFSMLTGTTCRACIKTTFPDQRRLYIQTLARDSRSDDNVSTATKSGPRRSTIRSTTTANCCE